MRKKKKIRESFLETVKDEKVYDWVVLNHLEKGKIFFFQKEIALEKKNEKPTMHMGDIAMWLKYQSMKEGSKV